jgi:hypothetical protein
MLEAGFTQMNVDVDKAGRHKKPRGIEHFRACGVNIRANLANDSILNRHIGRLVEMFGRVNHAAIF